LSCGEKDFLITHLENIGEKDFLITHSENILKKKNKKKRNNWHKSTIYIMPTNTKL
jgi:hypothetical protein